MKIDLNSDLGESFGAWTMGDDAAMLGIVTSANVACGYHAGDPVTMDRTVRAARAAGVDLGAHVSFPDLAGFGRRAMRIEPRELELHIVYQLGALEGIARAAGHRITHVSPHGALGNIACADRATADVLVRAIRAFDPRIAMLVLSNTQLERAAEAGGLASHGLFLADRAYDRVGQLVPRGTSGAMVTDEVAILARVARVLEEGRVVTAEGDVIRVAADSILVHGDTAGAVGIARAIRRRIEAAGGEVVPLSARAAA
jgi:UPF0271 protein